MPPPTATPVPPTRVALGPNLWVTYEPAPGSETDDEGLPWNLLLRVYRGGEQVQEIPVEINSRLMSDADVLPVDYNFDGYMDFSCPDSAGNVQIFRAVYLYSPKTKRFERSEAFSQLPCIQADAARKRVGGYCFHSSAVENWQEEYAVRGHDGLELTRMWGTRPSSAMDDFYFVYDTVYKNGRIISNKEKKVPFKEDK